MSGSNTDVIQYSMDRGEGLELFKQVAIGDKKYGVSRIDIGDGYVDKELFLYNLKNTTKKRLPAVIVSLIHSYRNTESEDSILLQLGYDLFTRTTLLVPHISESIRKGKEPFINGKDVTKFRKEWPSLSELRFYSN